MEHYCIARLSHQTSVSVGWTLLRKHLQIFRRMTVRITVSPSPAKMRRITVGTVSMSSLVFLNWVGKNEIQSENFIISYWQGRDRRKDKMTDWRLKEYTTHRLQLKLRIVNKADWLISTLSLCYTFWTSGSMLCSALENCLLTRL